MKYVGWVATVVFTAWLTVSLLIWFVGAPKPDAPGIFYYQECRIGKTVRMWPTGIHRTLTAKALSDSFCKEKP